MSNEEAQQNQPFNVREIEVEKYAPERIMQNLTEAGIKFDPAHEVYRCFLRTSDDKPITPEYPDSKLTSVEKNLLMYGCEYNPLGQSIGILKNPLMTYAVPHANFGEKSNQVGFIVVYDSTKNQELFSGYATPKLDNKGVHDLKDAIKTVVKISYK